MATKGLSLPIPTRVIVFSQPFSLPFNLKKTITTSNLISTSNSNDEEKSLSKRKKLANSPRDDKVQNFLNDNTENLTIRATTLLPSVIVKATGVHYKCLIKS